MFGYSPPARTHIYTRLKFAIAPGQIVAVTGPSGSGKTVLLRRLARRFASARGLDIAALARCPLPAVDALAAATLKASAPWGGEPELARRMDVLSRCGLAEVGALLTPCRALSGGQLYRLALARAIYRAGQCRKPVLLLADEFASCLDLDTARIVCRQLRKLISASGLALVVATPRHELLADLAPDKVIYKPIACPPRFLRRPRGGRRERFRIVRGDIHDYDALSQFHYLAGRPAAHKRVYVVRRRGPLGVAPAAVLVVSPPVPCVRGRNIMLGRRYLGRCRKGALARLNREMECISRVIVHPVYRGCGLAVRLVRHALRQSPTPYVEALAAMGAVHPLFQRAGMVCGGSHMGRRGTYRYYLWRRGGGAIMHGASDGQNRNAGTEHRRADGAASPHQPSGACADGEGAFQLKRAGQGHVPRPRRAA
jgi:ABC-type lipoprotein export system ATPase subunit/GNAT superfamily N-acetyltransferase